ncbi:hypothetical protein JCM11251_005746 [Rhodosporidiobolus azoricus]
MMQPSNCLVLPQPYSVRATTTSSHPQLRDLLVFTPDAGNSLAVVCYDSFCSVDLYASRPPEYTPLRFSPSTIAYGMGLVAAGGQASEIALKSAATGQDWCHQYLPASSPPTVTGVRTAHSGSINNSICIAPSPSSSSTPRLLVSNNDEKIAVYDVAGRVPGWQAAKRKRTRERREGWSVVEASQAAERGDKHYGETSDRRSHDGEEDVEEQHCYDDGGECGLVPVPHEDIRLRTAVNHCSVSPDGRRMVAVGDTNEVFMYDCRTSGYELAQCFEASSDASFSTDWSSDGVTFSVASQDGFVHVYDVRNLPSSSSSASPLTAPRKVAELKTSQTGPAGAARKVKFSPGGARLDGGLLAFTEHRNRVHVVDARTFESYQILDVPVAATSVFPSISVPTPPPLRPRPQPPPRAFRPRRPPLSRFGSTASGGSGTRTPKDEVERDEFEREMRERSERRLRDEERRLRERAREERRRNAEEERQRRVRRTATQDDEDDEEEEGEEEEEEDHEEEHETEVVDEYGQPRDYDTEEEEEEDEEMVDQPTEAVEVEEEEDDSDSEASSVNTTRPRRFDGGQPRSQAPPPPSATFPSRPFNPSTSSRSLFSRSSATHTTFSSSSAFASTTPDDYPPVRRNFSGYAPLHANSTSRSSVPSYTTPTTFASTTRSGTSYYYSTYVPSSYPTQASPTSATSSSSVRVPIVQAPGFTSLFAAPLTGNIPADISGTAWVNPTSYHSTSAFFPLDTAPGDLLGLDWDEWGERLMVATGERVWEWDVDARARRGRGEWGVR